MPQAVICINDRYITKMHYYLLMFESTWVLVQIRNIFVKAAVFVGKSVVDSESWERKYGEISGFLVCKGYHPADLRCSISLSSARLNPS